MKTCSRCRAEKPVASFHRNRSKRDGLSSLCKSCDSARQRQYAARTVAARRARDEADPQAATARRRGYYENRRDRALEEAREAHRAEPLAYIKRRYGITPEQYEAMYADQRGTCAIRGVHADRLLIDHDHASGAVRGLLCKSCNFALGHLRDSAENAERAATYLRVSHHRAALAARKEVHHVG